ncbi:MAG TPA: nucleotidyl transferase AbiEii/AbiGii toxin family protein [Smithellaceae bacterium]|nr:nucleotidyl transferase AbiEii/AbiGii toxin family protein [Smithellaceae bacterium]
MKTYRETHIRQAEIAQLILLHQLYAQKESRHLIFQGGTAIRWCYGGSRFSEDLDFVTALTPAAIEPLVSTAVRGAEKLMVPHFGQGIVTLVPKKSRDGAFKCFVDFQPQSLRGKISVKLEFEALNSGNLPDRQNHVMASLSPVAYLIAAGEFRVPRPNTVLVAQTPQEILSDKIRALLERRYLKGRDFFDLWHLRDILKTPLDVTIVERKFTLYKAVFTATRSATFFTKPTKQNEKQMREAIEQDLSRFLPSEVLEIHRAEKFARFLDTTRSVFAELESKGVRLP